jgi:hypothetical protein
MHEVCRITLWQARQCAIAIIESQEAYLLGRSDVPDASGAVGRLHRDQHKLSSEDLKLTEQFVEMLLKRGAQKKDDE